MARARNIKPGFFTNDELVELPFATRLLFIGLWTIADREGRMVDRPKKIKMEIFPADDVDCDKALSDLAAAGFIHRYQADNVKVIEIINFVKHQAPHSTEKDSALPDADGFYTVNERTKNGGVTGKFTKMKKIETSPNVNPLLDNVKPQDHNALNPDSPILNPDSPTTTDASAPAAGGGGEDGSRETGNANPPADPADLDAPKAAPLPPRQDPPEPTSPALALTLVLRPLGVNVMSTNPIVIGWAERNVSADLLAEAVRVARESKGNETISPQYLVPIVERLLSPPPERRSAHRAGSGQSQKFHFSEVDRSADVAMMQAQMAARGVTQADLDDDSPL
jgi:hypothetical protein